MDVVEEEEEEEVPDASPHVNRLRSLVNLADVDLNAEDVKFILHIMYCHINIHSHTPSLHNS